MQRAGVPVDKDAGRSSMWNENAPELAALPKEARQEAFERFQLLQPALEQGVSLMCVSETSGTPYRTLQRWLGQYRDGGLVGLVRQSRKDLGTFRSVSIEMQRLIEGLALAKPPPTVASVHRRIRAWAEERKLTAPSYGTVATIINKMDPQMRCLAHMGAKSYDDLYGLLFRMDVSGPNAQWQADHTWLDIRLIGPKGETLRPWLTCIVDTYSRALAGYILGFEAPSAQITSLALRRAIWRKSEPTWHICGIPDVFYTDHGSDFTSQHLEQVAADLKMHLVFSTVGVPRGRGVIERFFLTVNQLFLADLPGYSPAGHDPGIPMLTLSQLDSLFRSFVLNTYHQRVHGALEVAPMARWDENAFLPRMPDSLQQLDLLLLQVAKPRRVQQDGIRFGGMRYIAATLAGYVGNDVTIRYDPNDVAEIRVFHDHAFVCTAVCQDIAGQILSLKDIAKARNERRQELRGEIKERQTLVDRLLAAHSVPAVSAQAPVQPPPVPPAPPSPKLKRYRDD